VSNLDSYGDSGRRPDFGAWYGSDRSIPDRAVPDRAVPDRVWSAEPGPAPSTGSWATFPIDTGGAISPSIFGHAIYTGGAISPSIFGHAMRTVSSVVVLESDRDQLVFSNLYRLAADRLTDARIMTPAGVAAPTAQASLDAQAVTSLLHGLHDMWYQAGRYGQAGLAVRRFVIGMLCTVVVILGLADGIVHLDDHHIAALGVSAGIVGAGAAVYAVMPKGKGKS